MVRTLSAEGNSPHSRERKQRVPQLSPTLSLSTTHSFSLRVGTLSLCVGSVTNGQGANKSTRFAHCTLRDIKINPKNYQIAALNREIGLAGGLKP